MQYSDHPIIQVPGSYYLPGTVQDTALSPLLLYLATFDTILKPEFGFGYFVFLANFEKVHKNPTP